MGRRDNFQTPPNATRRRSKSNGRKHVKTPNGFLGRKKSKKVPAEDEGFIRGAGLSVVKIERALDFVDASGDGSVTRAELKGSLMAIDIGGRQAEKICDAVLASQSWTSNEDIKETEMSKRKMKARIIKILANATSDEHVRNLLVNALHIFVSQWEEEFSMFKWKRVVQGCVCFLFPIPFLLPKIGALFGLSPERTAVFIPKTFLGSPSQVWPVEEREALMNTLENVTKKTNVQFQVSDLTFRIVLSKADDPIKL